MKQTPLKALKNGAVATGLGEFEPGDAIGIDAGGTGAVTTQGARDSLDVPGKSTTNTFSGANRGAIVPLVDGATISPNFDAGNNFSLLLGGNRTLANPFTVPVPGQSGWIQVSQDATGGRTLAWGAFYKFAGGSAPILTTTANAKDKLYYCVESATEITVSMKGDVR